MKVIRSCFAICVLLPGAALAQRSAEDSLALMRPGEGLEVTLFAAEPDLRNPTSIDIDAEGRVWVCEAANYRLFNQPAGDPAGDRIRVLEDTDGDGRCDRATTFYQDPSLQAPMGIAVLGRRVYVCQSPDLFYLEDTDGDGRADKRTVVLTGFGGIDNDHAIHGVTFGPDGLLYFSNGDRGLDVTDKSGNRVHVGKEAPHAAGTVLRSDMEGVRLELLAEGMRNPYEPTVDSYGSVFISDNDDDGNEQCRINYVMEGGNYGFWPRRKGDRRLDAVHWNEDRPGVVPKIIRTGFGSPTGLMTYEGFLLPRMFRNTLIHADAGPRVIRSFALERLGAGYTATIRILLANEEDTWFRPSDVCAAPDGSLFIADWYDPGVGGHRMEDYTRGRIYRLAPEGKPLDTPVLDLDSPDGLLEAFASPNTARRFLATEILAARLSSGDAQLLQDWATNEDPVLRSRALWLLSRDVDASEEALRHAALDDNPRIRSLAVRILSRQGCGQLRRAERLLDDQDPRVRRQLLLELTRCAGEGWADDWRSALILAHDGEDRFYREAIGIASRGRESPLFRDFVHVFGDDWDARFSDLALQWHPPEAQPIAIRAMNDVDLPMELRKRALAVLDAIGSREAGEALMSMLHEDAPADLLRYALSLLSRDEGDAWRVEMSAPGFDEKLAKLTLTDKYRSDVWRFIRETRRTAFLPETLTAASDSSLSDDDRRQALEAVQALLGRATREVQDLALEQLRSLVPASNSGIAVSALQAINALPNERGREALRGTVVESALVREVRLEAVRLLSKTKPGSVALLDLADQGKLPEDLRLEATALVHASPYDDVRMMADRILPRDRTREGDALPSVTELLAMRGDPLRGRDVFFSPERSQCYRCHRVAGEGQQVGPDLTAIGQKYGPDALLEAILNPSSAVAPEYQVWIVDTESTGFLSGFIRSESESGFDLMDSAGNTIRVEATDVIERRKTPASLMPTGLAAGMSAQELVDLVAFLGTLK